MSDTDPFAKIFWRAQGLAGAGAVFALAGYWVLQDPLSWGPKTAMLPFGIGIAFMISAMRLLHRIEKPRQKNNEINLPSYTQMTNIGIGLQITIIGLVMGHIIFTLLATIKIVPSYFINFWFFVGFLFMYIVAPVFTITTIRR